MRTSSFVRWAAAAGLALSVGSSAFARLNSADKTQWIEDGGSGFSVPPNQAESGSGFGAIWDTFGRVLSNAAVTDNLANGTPLNSISPLLWQSGDADLYKITITDPTNFSASVTNTSVILALFKADGTAVAGSTGGGAANAITGANTTIPGAGIYYLGEATSTALPKNAALQNLFDFSTTGVKAPLALADQKLGTDPYNAWTIPGGSSGNLLNTSSSFVVSGAQINLTGAGFAVPEPGTLALLTLTSGAMLTRRRRTA